LRVFRAQDIVQLFDETQELLTILFLLDKRTEFVDPVALNFVHMNAAVLQSALGLVCSMSNTDKTLSGDLKTAASPHQ
jgi:hypothetical protein